MSRLRYLINTDIIIVTTILWLNGVVLQNIIFFFNVSYTYIPTTSFIIKNMQNTGYLITSIMSLSVIILPIFALLLDYHTSIKKILIVTIVFGLLANLLIIFSFPLKSSSLIPLVTIIIYINFSNVTYIAAVKYFGTIYKPLKIFHSSVLTTWLLIPVGAFFYLIQTYNGSVYMLIRVLALINISILFISLIICLFINYKQNVSTKKKKDLWVMKLIISLFYVFKKNNICTFILNNLLISFALMIFLRLIRYELDLTYNKFSHTIFFLSQTIPILFICFIYPFFVKNIKSYTITISMLLIIICLSILLIFEVYLLPIIFIFKLLYICLAIMIVNCFYISFNTKKTKHLAMVAALMIICIRIIMSLFNIFINLLNMNETKTLIILLLLLTITTISYKYLLSTRS